MARATKKKAGRKPIQVTPALCRKAERLAAGGRTEKQVAVSLGFSQETLIQKKKQFAEFSEAIKKGQAKAIVEVENALFVNATENEQVVAQIFFLKNRNPDYWKDKQEVEHSGEGLGDLIKAARERVTRAPSES